MSRKTIEGYRQEIVDFALTCVGKNTDRNCMQFVQWVLQTVEFPIIGDAANAQKASHFFDSLGVLVHAGPHNSLHIPGDLVFRSANGGWPSHVGIMVNKKSYVDTSTACREIRLRKLAYKVISREPKDGYVKLYTHNPIGFKRLVLPD